MDSKTTSTTKRFRQSRQSGATVTEFVMAGGIGAVIVAVILSFALYQGRSFAVIFNISDMDQANRIALDQLTQQIRQVNKVTAYATNSVVFEDYDNVALTYRFDPTARTLSRTKGGTTQILLREIESLTFALMQRNIVDGSYAYYPAETVAECKVLSIVWETSRAVEIGRAHV